MEIDKTYNRRVRIMSYPGLIHGHDVIIKDFETDEPITNVQGVEIHLNSTGLNRAVLYYVSEGKFSSTLLPAIDIEALTSSVEGKINAVDTLYFEIEKCKVYAEQIVALLNRSPCREIDLTIAKLREALLAASQASTELNRD